MDRAMDIDGVFKKCYQSCDFQSEKIMVTTADYPSRNNFENRNGMCLVIKKLDIICQNEIKFKIFEEFYITHPTYPKSGSFCALVKSQIDGEICEHNFTLPNKQKTIDQDLYKFVVTYTRDNIVKMKFLDPVLGPISDPPR